MACEGVADAHHLARGSSKTHHRLLPATLSTLHFLTSSLSPPEFSYISLFIKPRSRPSSHLRRLSRQTSLHRLPSLFHFLTIASSTATEEPQIKSMDVTFVL